MKFLSCLSTFFTLTLIGFFILPFIPNIPISQVSHVALAAIAPLKVGDSAPSISLKTQEGKNFRLESRKGKWTVLYFYPKAGTPGCTKQAQFYRDLSSKIKKLNAEVIGISTDDVTALKDFHRDQKLNFTLLSDEQGSISENYGTKMPLLNVAQRWTFIIGPDLKIRSLDTEVEASEDAEKTLQKLHFLQKS